MSSGMDVATGRLLTRGNIGPEMPWDLAISRGLTYGVCRSPLRSLPVLAIVLSAVANVLDGEVDRLS